MDCFTVTILQIILFQTVATIGHEIEPKTTDCPLHALNLFTIDHCFDNYNRDVKTSKYLPSGTVCIVVCPYSETKAWRRCHGGNWIGDKDECKYSSEYSKKERKRKRFKRGWGSFWRGVGNFFVGVAKGISCIFTLFIPRHCRGGPPPDRTKPSLRCPPDMTKTANPRELFTQVYWKEPVAYDNRDGRIAATRIGRSPGSRFREETTKIKYYARDRSGNMATCSFSVKVKVTRCDWLQTIHDGSYKCVPSNDMRRGASCIFSCHRGYELKGASELFCTDSGLWDNRQPWCKKVTCPTLPPSVPSLRYTCTDGNNFRSMCTYSCPSGYDFESGMTRVRVCTAYRTWRGDIPRCKDVTPPRFSNCSSVWYGYADKNSTKGNIIYKIPTVTDNKDTSVIPFKISGPSNGALLSAGIYTVKYGAKDLAGNKATICKMKLIMKVITCPKIIETPYMTVVCPTGRRYGSACEFKCANGTLINGTETAVCKRSSHGNYGYWSFEGKQPFCDVLKRCAVSLNVPENGALACDYWLGGKFCQMQCREGYDVPPGYPFYQMMVCGESGRWLPSSHLPDCSRRASTRFVRARMSTFYYFDGDCHEEAVVNDVKSNFIEALTRSTYKDSCLVYAENCKVGNIQVICGAKAKKRSVGLRIIFDLEFELKDEVSSLSVELLSHGVKNISRLLQEDLQTYYIPLTDSVNTSSHLLTISSGDIEIICPNRTVPSKTKYTCVTCVKGSYYNAQEQTCPECPRGQYQPEDSQNSCLSCSGMQTTRHTGATDQDMCEKACMPGSWSPEGVPPCSSCDIGTYQPNYGSISCNRCPGSKTTSTEGSTSQDDCQDFDIYLLINGSATISLTNKESMFYDDDFTSFYITFWLKLDQIMENKDILTLIDTDNTTMFRLYSEDSVYIGTQRSEVNTGVVINETHWQYILLKANLQNTSISIDDEELILDDTSFSFRDIKEIILGGRNFQGSISQLNIWSNNMEKDEPIRSCKSNLAADLFNWKMFEAAEFHSAVIQMKSECDEINNCKPNPCYNGECTDEFNSYTCTCKAGYSGTQCEINIDDCINNICENNSTCVDGVLSYQCLCPDGFKGELCNIEVVDGQWSDWGEWSSCSVTCNNGTMERNRLCNSPTPSNGGKDCEGHDMDVMDCIEQNCPVCDVLEAPENGFLTCSNDTEGRTINCSIKCNDGFDFDHQPKDYYLCGHQTFFLWDFQTNDNPYRRLPNCVRIKDADDLQMSYDARYADLVCSDFSSSDIVIRNIQHIVNTSIQDLECIISDTCTVRAIKVSNCEDNEASDSNRTAGFSVEFSCSPKIHGSEVCYTGLIKTFISIKHMVDNGTLNLLLAGNEYEVESNSSVVGGEVKCEPGSVQVNFYCIPCAAGRYYINGECRPCEYGTYQNITGRTNCVPCPAGRFTLGRGSKSINDCNRVMYTKKMLKNFCYQPLMTLIKSLRHWLPPAYYHYYWKLREITNDRCRAENK